jgi:FkbM family methyltransferase
MNKSRRHASDNSVADNLCVEALDLSRVRLIRGVWLWRALQRLVPLGRKYHPLLYLVNSSRGFFAIPYGRFHLVHPAAWRKYTAKFLLNGVHTNPEFHLLEPLCRPPLAGCIVDVGANIGIYVLLFRSVSKARIIAYEPQPFLYQLLAATVAYNRMTDVVTRLLACGNRRGTIPFAIGINGAVAPTAQEAGTPTETRQIASDAGRTADWDRAAKMTQAAHSVIHVPLTTLDEDLADTPVSILKVDCEGFELQILQGGHRLIETQRPVIFLELHPREVEKYGGSAREVVEFLAAYYDLEFWHYDLYQHRSKLVRSLLKYRGQAGFRFPDAAAVLSACAEPSSPSQIYVVCRPRPNGAAA